MNRLPLPTPGTQCERCVALCCQLTVVLQPGDDIPEHLVAQLPTGVRVMAQGASGWCAALDHEHMNCGIYEHRPEACRRFVMNGPHCRALRIDYSRDRARGIPMQLE
ncbi:YkgJ family cysteine cluster protein [Pseudoxanthomonas daejeonensis]|uniref:Zinc/iron-chelating domain-containing protein n=1 Tax=Pseudoxanthomonas daejeonensis TaxID=266062 RepID=A0ABQ6Z4I9_9GAMM|nr:YkgJ family cysteine cluster protein [Pseudoxanthomonas daejeonensis]KAF1692865.1 zinc/iron-chelating domain-containing protein [Pseudoxanthomonas daejeonensis]UNK57889.1 YkgJ family cysteine cluster protein [Pseudoxanthomonas daejeonensis]